MVTFNAMSLVGQDDRFWTPRDWAFLLNDIVVNQLRFPGRIYLRLNENYTRDGRFYRDEKLLDWFQRQGAVVLPGSSAVDLVLTGPKVFSA